MIDKSLSAASTQWVLDSGASHRMTNNIHLIRKVVKLPEPIFITTANDVTVMVEKARMVVISPEIIFEQYVIFT